MINKDGKTVDADVRNLPGGGRQCRLEFGARLWRACSPTSPATQSWPITAATWILIYKKPKDVAASTAALKFFAWAYENGGKMADELHYVPMPANVVNDIKNMWATEIKDASGKPSVSPTDVLRHGKGAGPAPFSTVCPWSLAVRFLAGTWR